MKKIFGIIFLCILSTVNASPVKGVKIVRLIGNNCRVQYAEQYHWESAKPNWHLTVGDRLRTYSNSEIELEVARYGAMRIGKNSYFDILKDHGNRDENIHHISVNGTVWGNINGKGAAFFVYTQNVTIRAKECSFKVISDVERQIVNILVFSGHLHVKANGKEFLIESSFQTVVSAHFGPTKPEPLDKDAEEIISQLILHEYEKYETDASASAGNVLLKEKVEMVEADIEQKKNIIKRHTERRTENHIKIKTVAVCGIDMDNITDRLTLYSDSLENGEIVITGTVSADIFPVEKVLVSINNGKNWNIAKGTSQFEFRIKPKNSCFYNVKINAFDKYNNSAPSSRTRYIIHYRKRTARQVLRQIVTNICRAYQDEDEHKIIEYVHQDYFEDKDYLNENLEDFFAVNDPVYVYAQISNIVVENVHAKVSFKWTKRTFNNVQTIGHCSLIFKKDLKNQWKILRYFGNKFF